MQFSDPVTENTASEASHFCPVSRGDTQSCLPRGTVSSNFSSSSFSPSPPPLLINYYWHKLIVQMGFIGIVLYMHILYFDQISLLYSLSFPHISPHPNFLKRILVGFQNHLHRRMQFTSILFTPHHSLSLSCILLVASKQSQIFIYVTYVYIHRYNFFLGLDFACYLLFLS